MSDGLLGGILGALSGGGAEVMRQNQTVDKEEENTRLENMRSELQLDREKRISEMKMRMAHEEESRKAGNIKEAYRGSTSILPMDQQSEQTRMMNDQGGPGMMPIEDDHHQERTKPTGGGMLQHGLSTGNADVINTGGALLKQEREEKNADATIKYHENMGNVAQQNADTQREYKNAMVDVSQQKASGGDDKNYYKAVQQHDDDARGLIREFEKAKMVPMADIPAIEKQQKKAMSDLARNSISLDFQFGKQSAESIFKEMTEGSKWEKTPQELIQTIKETSSEIRAVSPTEAKRFDAMAKPILEDAENSLKDGQRKPVEQKAKSKPKDAGSDEEIAYAKNISAQAKKAHDSASGRNQGGLLSGLGANKGMTPEVAHNTYTHNAELAAGGDNNALQAITKLLYLLPESDLVDARKRGLI